MRSTPNVVPMPSTSSLALPIRTGSTESSPGTARYTPRVTSATTLLTTGAHAGRPEYVAGVQDCHEHRREAVGEHLRQQQVGERGGQWLVDLRAAAQHQPDQQRRGRPPTPRWRTPAACVVTRDQAPDERGAAVGVALLGTCQHRHEDRGEGRLQHQRGDQVRQLIGHRESAGQRRTQNRGQQHDPGEAGDAG